jgi:hypothetical protein
MVPEVSLNPPRVHFENPATASVPAPETVTVAAEDENRAVVDAPIDDRRRRHFVGEDLLFDPDALLLAEDEDPKSYLTTRPENRVRVIYRPVENAVDAEA